MRPIDADNLISVLDILCDKGSDIRYWEQLKMIVADCPTIEQCGYWDNESNFCASHKPAALGRRGGRMKEWVWAASPINEGHTGNGGSGSKKLMIPVDKATEIVTEVILEFSEHIPIQCQKCVIYKDFLEKDETVICEWDKELLKINKEIRKRLREVGE